MSEGYSMGGMCQQCGDTSIDLRLVEFPRYEGDFNTGDTEEAWLCRACTYRAADRYEGRINYRS